MADTLREAALRLLARREHGQRELTRKLRLRGYEAQEIAALVATLAEEKLQDDARYVSMIIRSRSFRGIGPLKIVAELQKQGIDRHCIQSNEAWQEISFEETATRARIKRFGETCPTQGEAAQQQRRFLVQRGFDQEHIDFAINNDRIKLPD